jgi:ornithine cyclodeaminase/alanine dehydrogenase-like protein (mu-crystallin family)
MVTMSEAIEAVEQDFKRQAVPGSMIFGVPLAYTTEDRQLGFRSRLKSAIIRDLPVAGVRVTGFKITPDGIGTGGGREATRYIILSDPATSSPLAIIDEHSTFPKRTSAAICVAGKYLARKESAVLGLIGVGNIGQTALLGFKDLFPIREVKVTSMRPESRRKFAEEMSKELNLPVTPVDSAEEACQGADIIVAGTASQKPFIRYDWLADGAFLAVVGEHEATHEVYEKCDALYVDYNPETEKHPAHIQEAIDAGAIGPNTITGQIWEVVAGKKLGRRNAKDKILVSTVGLTTQDIAIAYHVYLQAKKEGRGLRLPF